MDWVKMYNSGKAINHKEFLKDFEKDRTSGRNIVAWACTQSLLQAVHARESYHEGYWPSRSVASGLLTVQLQDIHQV